MAFLRRVLRLSGLAAASSPPLVRRREWGAVSRTGCRSFARTPCLRPLSARLRTACATWLLPLLLVTPPAALQAQFTYVTNNGTITITGYTGFTGFGVAVAIPDRLPDPTNGLAVTAIGEYAFTGLYITNVVIPNSVISIGNYAFEGCEHLYNVIIPGSVVSIADYAFANCKFLSNVIISNGVIIIGDHAFEYSNNLRNVVIPDSVMSIGPYAFRMCALTNIPIGRGLTSIEDYTFAACSFLTNITIPINITSIGAGAFSGCLNLTGVYFEGDAPNGGSLDVFSPFSPPAVILYYLPGTTRWGSTFGGSPAVLWNPQAQAAGVRANRFGFNITGTTNIPIVVEASTSLGRASWTALQTCTLTNGSIYFSDPAWRSYHARFYRIRSP